ncbi:MAG: hypothetical protein E6J34_12955 [Chloroflexi bacterium]|nr:MAG: hypothetical protein E6J34_12955 [Chloroflexota bacterium]
MALAVTVLLGMIALVFVLYPLFRYVPADGAMNCAATDGVGNATDGVDDAQEHTIKSPTEQEQQARAALQEVELDYQLGNIAEPDYRSLRERYMRKALVALKARYEQELDAEIEEQLRKLKEQDKDEAE